MAPTTWSTGAFLSRPPERYLPLFCYGTLRDPDLTGALIGDVIVRRAPARVRGRRVPIDAPYPAVVFGGSGPEMSADQALTDIEGELLWLAEATYAEKLAVVDRYEGLPTLYRRVVVSAATDSGPQPAWAYDWVGRTVLQPGGAGQPGPR